MTLRYTFLILLLLAFVASCEVINPDEKVPAYIHIDKISVDANLGQGTDSSNISDAWIYINSELIGAFQLPATIPILKAGNQDIEIRSGVIINGIASTRTINPFYSYQTKNIKLIPDSIISFNVKTDYHPSVKFVWNSIGQEGFEEGGISIDSAKGSTSKIFKTSSEVYEGGFSGQIHLDEDHKIYIGQSTEKYILPKSGKAVVLEINCKNISNHFVIGMFVHETGGKVVIVNHLVVNPGPKWKKLYVNFTELVSHYPKAERYRVFFTSELETTNTSADIYLDNIKLIHF